MTATLENMTARLRHVRRRLDRESGEARALFQRGQELQTEVATLGRDVDLATRAAALLTTIGEDRQTQTQLHIEALVTQGLQTIFGDDLSFHLVPSVRSKTPVVDFVIRSTLDNEPLDTDILDARGGGLAATVGFLLRVVVLLLSADKQDTVMVLDETFAHVSAEYEPRLAEFIRELVDKTGVQVIMVTHSEAFSDVADVRYRFRLEGGITHVDAV